MTERKQLPIVSNFLEFNKVQIDVDEIVNEILQRHDNEEIRELQIYHSPSEMKSFYVINGVHYPEYFVKL
jgi:hypothetical protein